MAQLEFSLLALRTDPLPTLQAQLSALQAAGRANDSEAAELVAKIANEQGKRGRWDVRPVSTSGAPRSSLEPFLFLRLQFENSLRRHNHVGLMYALLIALAKAGKLESAKEGARSAMKERVERRGRGEAMDE
jgi:ubiquitin carboxyl-terminal hydrolase L5